MDAFLHFIFVDGSLLIGMFFGITFLVSLLQQYASTNRLTDRMAAAPLGLSNVYAALGGAVTPFCSCSTVPVLSGMLRTGMRFGVCFTFLMASPLVNEAVIVVMWQYFGTYYLISFVGMALVIPVIFGILFDYLQLGQFVRSHARYAPEIEGNMMGDGNSQAASAVPWRARLRFAALMSKNETIGVLPYLVIGLVVGGLIYGFVPEHWINWLSLNLNDAQLILLMALLGVPFYFNIVVVIPVAFALAEKGLGLGPITAFLVAGAGTSLPELILLWRLFKGQLIAAYVVAMLATAVAMGFYFSI